MQSPYRSNDTKRTQTTSIKQKRNQMTFSPKVADSANEAGTAKKSVHFILQADSVKKKKLKDDSLKEIHVFNDEFPE